MSEPRGPFYTYNYFEPGSIGDIREKHAAHRKAQRLQARLQTASTAAWEAYQAAHRAVIDAEGLARTTGKAFACAIDGTRLMMGGEPWPRDPACLDPLLEDV
jgi:hypothetical protein